MRGGGERFGERCKLDSSTHEPAGHASESTAPDLTGPGLLDSLEPLDL
jgi:hypothetical protein